MVSIDAVSQDAKAIIAQLAASAGVNVVVDDSIVSKVTVHLADVPFDHALETIARAAGAEVAAEKGLYVVTNSRAYYGPPQAAAEQTVSQILDVANVEFSSALTLVRAVAKDLEIEPFPELGAVMLRGPYSQVNAAKAALDGYLRSSSPYGQADVQGFCLARLAYADASEASMSLQGQFQSVRIVPVRGDSDGGIVVTLTPRISAVTGFSREGYPVMSTREAQTTVRLRDGETLAIGGLIRDETNESRSGLPWLSSLGLIGRLFGSQSKQAKRTEVVILLTPRIVDPERNNRE